MSDPRRLYALDFESTSGGLRVTLLDGAGELGQFDVARAELAAREELVIVLDEHVTRELTSLYDSRMGAGGNNADGKIEKVMVAHGRGLRPDEGLAE